MQPAPGLKSHKFKGNSGGMHEIVGCCMTGSFIVGGGGVLGPWFDCGVTLSEDADQRVQHDLDFFLQRIRLVVPAMAVQTSRKMTDTLTGKTMAKLLVFAVAQIHGTETGITLLLNM